MHLLFNVDKVKGCVGSVSGKVGVFSLLFAQVIEGGQINNKVSAKTHIF
jgi:hypothetical protein